MRLNLLNQSLNFMTFNYWMSGIEKSIPMFMGCGVKDVNLAIFVSKQCFEFR
ncbi:unnamed protein product [Meloidogyne enterolobii]|uniref:Uncharacterized protein n=1 Tax=Meloidogyne enterolobii TaxID=390850 RepID=A0ACB0YY48_MELEN